ncbi:MAG: hypothetical protein NC924_04190 [Candidatus Omnitrophica bacterium]|nr:hypothetical protein [Candidatus Omnitrophota bacterium]
MNKLIAGIAAKRFSPAENAGLLVFFLVVSAGLYWLVGREIDAEKARLQVAILTVPPDAPAPNAGSTAGSPREAVVVGASEKISDMPAPFSPPPAAKKRDPFLPSLQEIVETIISPPVVTLPPPVQKPAPLEVTGILWDEKYPTAIINSRVVKIGDLIEGKTVVDIEQNRVLLMEDGQLLFAPLHQVGQSR